MKKVRPPGIQVQPGQYPGTFDWRNPGIGQPPWIAMDPLVGAQFRTLQALATSYHMSRALLYRDPVLVGEPRSFPPGSLSIQEELSRQAVLYWDCAQDHAEEVVEGEKEDGEDDE